MKKIELLLDETTVINFELLIKLAMRYKTHFQLALLFFVLALFSFYYSQPEVYSIQVPVRTIVKHNVSSDLSSLIPVAESEAINQVEFNLILNSHSFLSFYAGRLQESPYFNKMIFGNPSYGKKIEAASLIKSCGSDKGCISGKLIPALSGSFTVEHGISENRFNLMLFSFDQQSLLLQKKIFVSAVDAFRIQGKQYQISKELASVEDLIRENQNSLQASNGLDLLDKHEKNNSMILEVKDRIRMLQVYLNDAKTSLTEITARSSENRRMLAGSGMNDRMGVSEALSLGKKIRDLRQNIAALSVLPEEQLSEKDKGIIVRLKAELSQLEKRRARFSEDTESEESFLQDQHGKEKALDFDLAVVRKKIKTLESELTSRKLELELLTSENIQNGSLVSKARHEVEFIKNLESKRLSLKLLASTITTDLLFEENGAGVREFQVLSLLKLFLFSFFLTFFLYGSSLIIRFLADDHIYSEDDLKAYFSHLDFIGDVPSFNS